MASSARLLEVKLEKTFTPNAKGGGLVDESGKVIEERIVYINQENKPFKPTAEQLQEVNTAFTQEVSGFAEVEFLKKMMGKGMIIAPIMERKKETKDQTELHLPSGDIVVNKTIFYGIYKGTTLIAEIPITFKLEAELKEVKDSKETKDVKESKQARKKYHLKKLAVNSEVVRDVLLGKSLSLSELIYKYKDSGVNVQAGKARFLPVKEIEMLVRVVVAEYRGRFLDWENTNADKATDIEVALNKRLGFAEYRNKEAIVNVDDFLTGITSGQEVSIQSAVESPRWGAKSPRYDKLKEEIDQRIAELAESKKDFKKRS